MTATTAAKTDDHIKIEGRPYVHRSDPVAGGSLCGYRKGVAKRTDEEVTCVYCRDLKPMKTRPVEPTPTLPTAKRTTKTVRRIK